MQRRRRPRIDSVRRRALGALWLVGIVGGCAASDEADGGFLDAPEPIETCHCTSCDPLAPAGQQGCNAGQKCGWIIVEDSPEQVGKIGCVPDGAVELDGACTLGPPGEQTGFDDCAAGAACVHGTCKDTCGFGGGANEACGPGQACARYAGLWANDDDDPLYGACSPACDPVSQRHPDGSSCGAGRGCYLLVSNTTSIAVCAPAGTAGPGTVLLGHVFANTCRPGYAPRRVAPDSMALECGALCDPQDVFVTDPADADSGARPAPRPAAQVTGFDAEGGLAPYTCASRGAPPPGTPTVGESCRYWWAREPFDDVSPYSNTAGWCFAHDTFEFDSDGDMAADALFPRCVALSSGDKALPVANPPHDDARYFWCKALPAMLRTSIKHAQRPYAPSAATRDRLAPLR